MKSKLPQRQIIKAASKPKASALKKMALLLATTLFLPCASFAGETHVVNCHFKKKEQRHKLEVDKSDNVVLRAVTEHPATTGFLWQSTEEEIRILSQFKNNGRLQIFTFPANRIEGDSHEFVFEYRRHLKDDEDGTLSICSIDVSLK